MDQVQGKHFSITDPQNVNTVIYQINKTEGLMEENTPKFTLERLKCREELVGLNKRKTFFVDAPKDEGNQLIILSFGQDRVVVNMGLLNKDEVRISKRPVPVKFDTIYSEQETEYKDVKYTPNFQRPITIIDPETTEEVKPVVYFDKDTNEVRGKCKLKPYKSYFVFEVREKNFDIPPKEMKLLSDYLKELKDPNRSIRIALQEEREQSVKKAIEREEK